MRRGLAGAGLAAMAAASVAWAAPRADLYVAPTGSDAWSGTRAAPDAAKTDGPFATLARARDAVRKAKVEGGGARPYTVLVRGGTYFLEETLAFSPEDSGADNAPITYGAYPGEKPVIVGGSVIRGWKKGPGNLWTAEIREVREGKWYFHQLFVDGERRTRARTPNDGYLRTAGPLPEIADPQKQSADPVSRLGFTFKDADLKAWPGLEDVNVVLYYDWSTSRHWIKSIDPDTHVVRFTNPTGWPVCYWERTQRYHVENYREALDEPGEWYLDRKTGICYYRPKPGENMDKATVVAPRLRHIVELQGDPENGRYVAHLEFRGLSFRYGEWVLEKTQQLEAQAAVFLSGAIYGRGVADCGFEGCEIAHVGEYAMMLEVGSKRNRIVHCEVQDTGGGGIKIGGEGFTDKENLISEGNVVDDCFIHDAGHTFPDGVGIWIGHASNNRISHNEICDIIYSGISAGWSWGYGPSGCHHNVIEYNHVHHLGFGVLSELGGIYTLGISTGTVIRNNLLHDTYDYAYGSWGLALDEGSSGILVENNIVYNHGHGFGMHYGKDNVIRNNIVAFCRADLLGMGRAEEHHNLDFDRNICYGNSGVVATGNWLRPTLGSDYNVYWDTLVGNDLTLVNYALDEWQEETGRDKHSVVADPRFVDAAKHDFRLKPDSPALKLGFRPINVSSVGLYGERDWVEAPGKIKRPPLRYKAPARPVTATSFEDGFEETAVGELPKLATPNGEGKGASIRVSDEAAATGKHSLKFTDAAGLAATWQPHMWYTVAVARGFAELSFDMRLEKGAVFAVAWRDWRSEMLSGPVLDFTAGGDLVANGKKVAQVPVGQWLHVTILAQVGRKSDHTYRLTVTKPGGEPIRLDGLPFDTDKFGQLTWIGFISNADGPAVTYLDNVRLRSGRSEALLR
jgi:parallel beta-helix repeat protein